MFVKNFIDIEKLIEKEVPKLDLPKGFAKGPEYNIQSKNKKKKKEMFKDGKVVQEDQTIGMN